MTMTNTTNTQAATGCKNCDGIGECPMCGNQAATPAGIDLDKLEALARAADPNGGSHLITHYRNSADLKAEEAWRQAATPAAVLELIAIARRAAQPVPAAQALEAWPVPIDAYTAPHDHPPLVEIAVRLAKQNREWSSKQIEDAARAEYATVLAASPAPAQEAAHADLDAQQARTIDCMDSWAKAQGLPTYSQLRAAQAQPAAAPTDAARDVLAERRRQVEQEGWTAAHDDQYQEAELSRAAAAYVLQGDHDFGAPPEWPWNNKWWKPQGERRNLVRAGALILAEIERLDRAKAAKESTHG